MRLLRNKIYPSPHQWNIFLHKRNLAIRYGDVYESFRGLCNEIQVGKALLIGYVDYPPIRYVDRRNWYFEDHTLFPHFEFDLTEKYYKKSCADLRRLPRANKRINYLYAFLYDSPYPAVISSLKEDGTFRELADLHIEHLLMERSR